TKALSSSVIRETLTGGYPAVTTLHDYFCACPNGGFFDYQKATNCQLVPLSLACVTTHCDARSYPQKLWRVGRQFVQRGAGRFPGAMRHFISVTQFSARILKRYLPEAARIHPVANPIDVPYGPGAAVQAHDGVVCVGRLSPEKGGVLLARACQLLGVPVTFVGDGPMRDSIRAACPAARITGWLPAQQVRAHMTQCRVLVLPSLWYETQGLVVGEAAALGVPAIVPDACAAREAVLDGTTGLWFRSGDVADLKAKISRLQADPALAAQMGRAAFERYWRNPATLQRHVGDLERVYHDVLASA
ncbi:MAG TPA: glycosyltransferase family 4 protein, partial [Ramlibacter sp.]|nr:glycosyltransferase family 4 protein [Ramlibacter sp.]